MTVTLGVIVTGGQDLTPLETWDTLLMEVTTARLHGVLDGDLLAAPMDTTDAVGNALLLELMKPTCKVWDLLHIVQSYRDSLISIIIYT